MECVTSNGLNDATKTLRRLLLLPTLVGALLGVAACVYVPPGPPPPSAGYTYAPAPTPQPGYYAAPQPGYYAPGYVYPPVVGSVNLGFGVGGGDRHGR
jgi:hypothetical protein